MSGLRVRIGQAQLGQRHAYYALSCRARVFVALEIPTNGPRIYATNSRDLQIRALI
jgi:hypothetical protein